MKDTIVIYHGNCADGFTSAYCAYLKLKDTAEYIPFSYGEQIPDVKDKMIYMLDFSFKKNDMLKLAKHNKIYVLDHHKTAEIDLKELLETKVIDGKFDMEMSGASLTWEHFHPGEEMPLFVKYVEDRDLWRFKLPYSKTVSMAVFSYEYTFTDWEGIFHKVEELKNEGSAILRKHLKDVNEISSFARRLTIGGYDVPAVNANYTYGSDIGNLLCKDEPFAAYYYVSSSGDYIFGLRSSQTGVDVSEIASKYGGGGHEHAAGFKVKSIDELQTKYV